MGSIPDIVKEMRIRESLGLYNCETNLQSENFDLIDNSENQSIKDTTLFEYQKERIFKNKTVDSINYSTKIIECSRLLIEIFPA